MKKLLQLAVLLLPVALWAREAVFPQDWVGHTFGAISVPYFQGYELGDERVSNTFGLEIRILSPSKVTITGLKNWRSEPDLEWEVLRQEEPDKYV